MPTSWGIPFFHSIGALTLPFILTPITKYFYNLAKKENLQAIYNREFYLAIGRIISLIILAIMIIIFKPLLGFIICLTFFGICMLYISHFYNKHVISKI